MKVFIFYFMIVDAVFPLWQLTTKVRVHLALYVERQEPHASGVCTLGTFPYHCHAVLDCCYFCGVLTITMAYAILALSH